MTDQPQNAGAPAAAAPPQQSTAKPEITFEDFARVDLRIARVVKAEDHPKADKLLRLQLDDGSGTPRQICAGIKGHYRAEDLEGRLIVIVAVALIAALLLADHFGIVNLPL